MNGSNFLSKAISRSAHLRSGPQNNGLFEKVIAGGILAITALVAGTGLIAGHKAAEENAAKQPHSFYQPDETAAYFQTLNKIEGNNCKIIFEDGKKNERPQDYPAVSKLGDCMQIAFNSNQKRVPSDRGLSITFNAADKSGQVSGDCDYRQKTDKPYCVTKTKTDKYFLELR